MSYNGTLTEIDYKKIFFVLNVNDLSLNPQYRYFGVQIASRYDKILRTKLFSLGRYENTLFYKLVHHFVKHFLTGKIEKEYTLDEIKTFGLDPKEVEKVKLDNLMFGRDKTKIFDRLIYEFDDIDKKGILSKITGMNVNWLIKTRQGKGYKIDDTGEFSFEREIVNMTLDEIVRVLTIRFEPTLTAIVKNAKDQLNRKLSGILEEPKLNDRQGQKLGELFAGFQRDHEIDLADERIKATTLENEKLKIKIEKDNLESDTKKIIRSLQDVNKGLTKKLRLSRLKEETLKLRFKERLNVAVVDIKRDLERKIKDLEMQVVTAKRVVRRPGVADPAEVARLRLQARNLRTKVRNKDGLITNLRENVSDLEDEKRILLENLERIREGEEVTEVAPIALAKIESLEDDLAILEQLNKKLRSKNKQLTEDNEEHIKTISLMSGDIGDHKKTIGELEEENEDLQSRVKLLEDTLEEAEVDIPEEEEEEEPEPEEEPEKEEEVEATVGQKEIIEKAVQEDTNWKNVSTEMVKEVFDEYKDKEKKLSTNFILRVLGILSNSYQYSASIDLLIEIEGNEKKIYEKLGDAAAEKFEELFYVQVQSVKSTRSATSKTSTTRTVIEVIRELIKQEIKRVVTTNAGFDEEYKGLIIDIISDNSVGILDAMIIFLVSYFDHEVLHELKQDEEGRNELINKAVLYLHTKYFFELSLNEGDSKKRIKSLGGYISYVAGAYNLDKEKLNSVSSFFHYTRNLLKILKDEIALSDDFTEEVKSFKLTQEYKEFDRLFKKIKPGIPPEFLLPDINFLKPSLEKISINYKSLTILKNWTFPPSVASKTTILDELVDLLEQQWIDATEEEEEEEEEIEGCIGNEQEGASAAELERRRSKVKVNSQRVFCRVLKGQRGGKTKFPIKGAGYCAEANFKVVSQPSDAVVKEQQLYKGTALLSIVRKRISDVLPKYLKAQYFDGYNWDTPLAAVYFPIEQLVLKTAGMKQSLILVSTASTEYREVEYFFHRPEDFSNIMNLLRRFGMNINDARQRMVNAEYSDSELSRDTFGKRREGKSKSGTPVTLWFHKLNEDERGSGYPVENYISVFRPDFTFIKTWIYNYIPEDDKFDLKIRNHGRVLSDYWMQIEFTETSNKMNKENFFERQGDTITLHLIGISEWVERTKEIGGKLKLVGWVPKRDDEGGEPDIEENSVEFVQDFFKFTFEEITPGSYYFTDNIVKKKKKKQPKKEEGFKNTGEGKYFVYEYKNDPFEESQPPENVDNTVVISKREETEKEDFKIAGSNIDDDDDDDDDTKSLVSEKSNTEVNIMNALGIEASPTHSSNSGGDDKNGVRCSTNKFEFGTKIQNLSKEDQERDGLRGLEMDELESEILFAVLK